MLVGGEVRFSGLILKRIHAVASVFERDKATFRKDGFPKLFWRTSDRETLIMAPVKLSVVSASYLFGARLCWYVWGHFNTHGRA